MEHVLLSSFLLSENINISVVLIMESFGYCLCGRDTVTAISGCSDIHLSTKPIKFGTKDLRGLW